MSAAHILGSGRLACRPRRGKRGGGRPAEAMRATRAAARCRRGQERRDGRLACAALPTSYEWVEALSPGGCEGGMGAAEFNYQDWHSDRNTQTFHLDRDADAREFAG
eukprot:8022769-Pyramimonas_sp.AAC.1